MLDGCSMYHGGADVIMAGLCHSGGDDGVGLSSDCLSFVVAVGCRVLLVEGTARIPSSDSAFTIIIAIMVGGGAVGDCC